MLDKKRMGREDMALFRILVSIFLLGLIILACDIYLVATGTTDLNKHLPFFISGICFVGPVVIWKFRGAFTGAGEEARDEPSSGANPSVPEPVVDTQSDVVSMPPVSVRDVKELRFKS